MYCSLEKDDYCLWQSEQYVCTQLRVTYVSVVHGGIHVPHVNPIIGITLYEAMVLPNALYRRELCNTYSKQEKHIVYVLKHAIICEHYLARIHIV